MCDKNINVLVDIDFSTTSDEFNWISNVSTSIETVSGQLRLIPEDSTSFFRRGLGVIDPVNNRVKVKVNLDLLRPQASLSDKMTVVFGVYIGSELIDQFTVYQENMYSGERIEQNFEREYKYDGLSGNVSLRISLTEGYSNQLFLDYLKAEDFLFCEDNVRTYFIIDEFLEKSLASVSSGVQLLEWKIDDIETLTTEFFTEIISTGGNPLAEWFFAKAEIDGSNRVAETTEPNSFNPFESELGLLFDTVSSYHGGKPTGTLSGSNYGDGIMTLGFEKPTILNGDLLSKKGAFFIDIDYSKNLKVVLNSLVNNTNSNVFDSPYSYRKYFIVWDAENCKSSFYYQDQLAENTTAKVPMDKNGFLYGITSGVGAQNSIGCSESLNYSGNAGTFEFTIDFGSDIGESGISYIISNIPVKFDIIWNEQTFTTGYVGSNEYDQQLINLGVSPSQINTENPANNTGTLQFLKSLDLPSTALIRITAPITGASWNISGICPEAVEEGEFTQITWNDTNTIEDRTGTLATQDIFYTGELYPVTAETWQKNINGAGWIDDGALAGVVEDFAIVNGENLFRLKALNAALEDVFSNVLKYTRYSPVTINDVVATPELSVCGGSVYKYMGLTINLNGNVSVDSNFFVDVNVINPGDNCSAGEIYVFSIQVLAGQNTATIDPCGDGNGSIHFPEAMDWCSAVVTYCDNTIDNIIL